MGRDILQTLSFQNALIPKDATGGAYNGTALDLGSTAPTPGSLACVVQIGDIGAAGASAFKLQESHDNSSWDDIAGAAFTNPTGSDDNNIYAAFVPINGTRRRYLRVTITGGANAVLVGALWIRANLNRTPSSAAERGVAQELFVT